MADEVQNIKEELLLALTNDLTASDLLVSLFWSALTSYRHDTVLRPFPQSFIVNETDKDIDGLKAVLNEIPSLKVLQQKIESLNILSTKLLHWIVCTRAFSVVTISIKEFATIESQTANSSSSLKPHSIFELKYSTECEQKWLKLSENYGTFLAYHGSKVENFHSITHNGLLSHMNKTSLFGEGTYLSTDLGVCMNFSPSAKTWSRGLLPSLCSMVAVCEVVDHPEIRSRVQYGGEPSLNQKIPPQYFVVTNNELVRVKYILVFAQERRNISQSYRWLSNHKWFVMILFYLLLLLLIGIWRSRYMSQLYYQYSKRYLSI